MIIKNLDWVRAFRMQAGYCVSFALCSIEAHLKRYDFLNFRKLILELVSNS